MCEASQDAVTAEDDGTVVYDGGRDRRIKKKAKKSLGSKVSRDLMTNWNKGAEREGPPRFPA